MDSEGDIIADNRKIFTVNLNPHLIKDIDLTSILLKI